MRTFALLPFSKEQMAFLRFRTLLCWLRTPFGKDLLYVDK